MTRLRLALAWLLWASAAQAVSCEDVTWEATPYTVCKVALGADLRLFHADASGSVYGDFNTLETAVGPLAFAMNAGMYHTDRSPVGLYRENSVTYRPVVLRAGPGNFGMLPNGVFCISADRLAVIESRQYREAECTHATQSGPMLVIDGDLHPRFLDGGTSKFIRNGVGTNAAQNEAYFVISNAPVNFHSFGRFFKDHLGVPHALYFDGNVSRLHAPELDRSDFGRPMGPMVAVLD